MRKVLRRRDRPEPRTAARPNPRGDRLGLAGAAGVADVLNMTLLDTYVLPDGTYTASALPPPGLTDCGCDPATQHGVLNAWGGA